MAALSGALLLGSAAMSLYGSQQQAQGQLAIGEFQKDQYLFNSKLAGIQADQALERGDRQASQLLAQGRKIQGSQRAAAAANGVDVNSGSAADLQGEAQDAVMMDYNMAKNNAWREAWGYKVQATDLKGQGNLASLAAQNQANNTMLTGGLQAVGTLSQYYGMKQDQSRRMGQGNSTVQVPNQMPQYATPTSQIGSNSTYSRKRTRR